MRPSPRGAEEGWRPDGPSVLRRAPLLRADLSAAPGACFFSKGYLFFNIFFLVFFRFFLRGGGAQITQLREALEGKEVLLAAAGRKERATALSHAQALAKARRWHLQYKCYRYIALIYVSV